MTISAKQQAFIESYLRCWNGYQAAIDAGYAETTARHQASRLLSYDNIQEAIAARLAELKMSANEVLTRLSDHARGSIASFIRVSPDGEVHGFDLSEDRPLHLLHKVSITKRRMKDATEEKLTIELYDAQSALALLGKHHKLFGDTGGVLKSLDLSKLSKEQVQRIADGEDPIAVLLSTDSDQGTGGAGAP